MNSAIFYASIFVSMFTSLLIAIILPLVFSGERWKAAQHMARERRLADARMNARLLRMNI